MTKKPWPALPAYPTVADIPEGTFWWKNAKDQWTIQRKGSGEELSASKSLRTAIIRAREAIDHDNT